MVYEQFQPSWRQVWLGCGVPLPAGCHGYELSSVSPHSRLQSESFVWTPYSRGWLRHRPSLHPGTTQQMACNQSCGQGNNRYPGSTLRLNVYTVVCMNFSIHKLHENLSSMAIPKLRLNHCSAVLT